jgi:uncharacterized protein YkwD
MINLKMNKRNVLSTFVLSVILSTAFISGDASEVSAQTTNFTDIEKHWAQKQIKWGVDQKIAAGYEDGTFRPNHMISEPEFLAMVVRADGVIDVTPQQANEPWYSPYYIIANEMKWPVSDRKVDEPYTRGDVARLIAAVQGKALSTQEAIQYLLDEGLANGKTSNTVEGFKAQDTLTRAEAMTFIYTLHNKRSNSDHSSMPSTSKALTLNGIKIGDTQASVIAKAGDPARKDVTNSGYTWFIYNHNFEEYAQVGIADGLVVSLYSNADGWTSSDGIAIGVSKDKIASVLGEPKQQGSGKYSSVYQWQGNLVTVYYDTLESNRVDALMLTAPNYFDKKTNLNKDELASMTKGYERQILDLTNVFRLRSGLSTLEWNELAAAAARKHSEDMGANHFFDHVNLTGQSPWDRMAAAGLAQYSSYGENIAAGYSNGIDAYNGWVNSSGHRSNMLNSKFETLGVGTAFGNDQSEYSIYYTQNFYTPMQ